MKLLPLLPLFVLWVLVTAGIFYFWQVGLGLGACLLILGIATWVIAEQVIVTWRDRGDDK